MSNPVCWSVGLPQKKLINCSSEWDYQPSEMDNKSPHCKTEKRWYSQWRCECKASVSRAKLPGMIQKPHKNERQDNVALIFSKWPYQNWSKFEFFGGFWKFHLIQTLSPLSRESKMSLSSLDNFPFAPKKRRQATPHVWPGGGDLGRCLEGGLSQVFRKP